MPLLLLGLSAASGSAVVEVAAIRWYAPTSAALVATGTTTSGGTASLQVAGPPAGHVIFRAAGTAAVASSGTTTTLAPGLPAGTQPGDWLACEYEGNAATAPTFSTTGWVEQASVAVGTGANSVNLRVFAKPADVGETAPTLTVASGRHTAQIVGWYNQDPTTPLDVAAVTVAVLDPAAVTPVTPNALPVAFVAARTVTAGQLHDFSTTTGVVRVEATMATSGANYGHAVVELAEWVAGPSDPAVTDAVAVSDGAAVTIALRPAAPAGAFTATGLTVSGGTVALTLTLPGPAGLTVSGGSAALTLAAALAATGTTVSVGTVAFQLAVAGPVGTTVSGGTASLSVSGAAPLSATGQTISAGSVPLRLAVTLTASGQTASGGAAPLTLAKALTATGLTTSGGAAAVVPTAALTATGQTASGGTAAVAVAALLAASGQTASGGAVVVLRLAVTLAASGQTASGGAATLAAVAYLTAAGTTTSAGIAFLISFIVGAPVPGAGRLQVGAATGGLVVVAGRVGLRVGATTGGLTVTTGRAGLQVGEPTGRMR